jgi:hypothetical protein
MHRVAEVLEKLFFKNIYERRKTSVDQNIPGENDTINPIYFSL